MKAVISLAPPCLALLLGACGIAGPFPKAGLLESEGFAARESIARTAALLPQEEKSPLPASKNTRMMVYTAAFSIQVPRVEESIERLLGRVEELGGYLSRRENATLTFRLPAFRFQQLVDELRGLGKVLQESMQARDVTKQHLDLKLRLENARAARKRLLALLERAEAVEDILKIEEALRRLTEEIERMQGELEFLEDQASFSTVAVTLVAAASRPEGSRRPSRFFWIKRVGVDHVLQDF